MTMKTIRPISTLVMATAAMMFSAQGQEFRDMPEKPDAPPVPEELKQHAEEPPAPDAAPRPEPWEDRVQREMLNRVRGEMMVPEGTQPGWMIGISVEPIVPFVRDHLGLDADPGVGVPVGAAGSPSAKAGIQVHDIIASANERKIATLEALKEVVEQSGKEGKPVSLLLIHRGKERTVSLEPTGPKPPAAADAEASPAEPAPPHALAEINRRLDRQQREIGKLRKELAKLRERLKDDDDDEKDEE